MKRGCIPNVWIGTSVENQRVWEDRARHLRLCPAAVRFLSCEPLLESLWLDTQDALYDWLHWVIIGVESAPGGKVGRLGEFRTEADWLDGAADIVRQCRDAGVSTFVKQIPVNGRVEHDISRFPRELQVREFPREQQEV